VKEPACGESDPDTKTRNPPWSLRYQGERGFADDPAVAHPQSVMLSPGKIGDVTKSRSCPGAIRAQDARVKVAEKTSLRDSPTPRLAEASRSATRSASDAGRKGDKAWLGPQSQWPFG
jgi:hypothetical protein